MTTITHVAYTTPPNQNGRSFQVAVGDRVKTDGTAGPPFAFVVEKADYMADRLMFRGKIRGRPVWCFADEVGAVETSP